MIFLIKKILSPFFYPLTFIILLLSFSLLQFKRGLKKKGEFWLCVAFLLLILVSFSWPTNTLLHSLEHTYPVLKDENINPDIPLVVVLGGGIREKEDYPLLSQLNTATAIRTIEGIRLLRRLKSGKIIFSGGCLYRQCSEAQLMKQLALDLGVKESQIILDETSMDTKDQAQYLKRSPMAQESFYLVTSAYHMRRSIALIKKQNLKAIPVPVAHLVIPIDRRPSSYFPRGRAFIKSEKLVREWLGWLWACLRGQASFALFE